MYKIFSKIITKRVSKELDENQPPEQAGFRAGYSTIDHLQTINQILEKFQEFRIGLYVAFVDFTKAFDCVEHPPVLEALAKQGIQKKYVRILAEIYSDNKAVIKTEKEGAQFNISRGVKQGDPISPKLFTCLLEQVFRQLEWQNQGIDIDGKKLTNLRFADDVILFAKSAKDLEKMLEQLQTQCKKVGLQMNSTKTKAMTNKDETPIQVGTETLKYVDEYVYLGQSVSFQENNEKEIKTRISLAWRKFWSLGFILLDKSQTLNIKKEILDNCVIPTLIYGAQTWTVTQKLKTSIQITQIKMERKILQVSTRDRIRNTEIRNRTQVKDAMITAQIAKWRWAGHTIRLNKDRWPNITTVWDPRQGERRPGRPRARWADELKKIAGNLWTRTAKTRDAWKAYEQEYKN